MRSHLFYQTGQKRPTLAEARGIYMWDVDGNRYIDGSSGAMVCNIGHSNPQVLEAMRRQMEKSTFGYRLHFETEPAEQLAAKAAALAPEGLDSVFFVSGGSEAVESAIKLARQYAVTQKQESRWKVISRQPSYHGATMGALALTGYKPLTEIFKPMYQEMPKIPAPTAYLDNLDPNDPETGKYYADMLEQKIQSEGPDTVLAFIVEPVGGASTGALVPPVGYMERIREICDQYGVILIYDEVMTGGGRTGRFFACEHHTPDPDIMTFSKGFAAGYLPLGAMIAHDKLVNPILENGGFLHGFTYAGNPLACAAGLAVLDEIEANGMVENAANMGALLKSKLTKLMERYPFIGDVRGQGLLLAFELVSDRNGMIPLDPEFKAFNRLVDIAYDNGLIIYSRRTRDGIEGDHFLVCPPMIITPPQIDEIMALLIKSIDQFAGEFNLPVDPSL